MDINNHVLLYAIVADTDNIVLVEPIVFEGLIPMNLILINHS